MNSLVLPALLVFATLSVVFKDVLLWYSLYSSGRKRAFTWGDFAWLLRLIPTTALAVFTLIKLLQQ